MKPTVFLKYNEPGGLHPKLEALIADSRDLADWFPSFPVDEYLLAGHEEGVALSCASLILYVAPRNPFEVWPDFDLYEILANWSGKPVFILWLAAKSVPAQATELQCVDLTDYESGLATVRDLIILTSQPPDLILHLPERSSYDGIMIVSGQINERLVLYYERNPNRLRELTGRAFEELVAHLFEDFGFDVELTAQTRDGGRDVVAIRKRETTDRYLIECKNPISRTTVGVRVVRELYGTKGDEQATKAILATTAHFSPEARLFIARHRWEIEGRDLEGVRQWLSLYRGARLGRYFAH